MSPWIKDYTSSKFARTPFYEASLLEEERKRKDKDDPSDKTPNSNKNTMAGELDEGEHQKTKDHGKKWMSETGTIRGPAFCTTDENVEESTFIPPPSFTLPKRYCLT